MRTVVVSGFTLLLFLGLIAIESNAQDIPAEVQRELDRRGMTAEQARQRARELGIDLNNPGQAARRARELGIPESTIQAWLQIVNRSETSAQQGLLETRPTLDTQPPTLDGLPVLSPPTLQLSDRYAVVRARIAFRDATSGVESVVSMLARQGADTSDTMGIDSLRADRVQRITGDAYSGSGTWEAEFNVSPDTPSGAWTLFVTATDSLGNTAQIETRASLRIIGTGETAGEAAADALRHFGYDVFRNIPDAFRPGAIEAAGPGYVVGPGDELRVTVWGGAEFQYDLEVDPEGRIFIPKVGQLTVAGKRLDDLRRDVRIWLSRSYAGLVDEPPTVFLDVSVTRFKPLQVFVLGEVPQPGGYTVPSGSSIFNVLYSVGGLKTSGSLRDVRVIRGARTASVDLYDYLLKGFSVTEVPLQTGDHIFIPPRLETVSIRGAVRRPAIYELKDDETVADLIGFAGGLQAEAYTRRFHIERIIPFAERGDPTVARTVLDLSLARVLSGDVSIDLEDGDQVTIVSIADATSLADRSRIPAVRVTGAIHKPGQFEIGPNVRTVRDLIETADGLTGNAYLQNADLVRLNEDLEREIVGLDMRRVMDDEPSQNLVLRPQDSLHVYSTAELEARRTVTISGQVRTPGEYPYLEGMTVSSLLFKGGGLRDSVFLHNVLLERADLVRRNTDDRTDEIIPFDLEAALQGDGEADIRLHPQDEIIVYEAAVVQPVREEERFVTIDGSVKEPGRFRYQDGMTLEDLVLRAGGFSEDAYLRRLDVTRPIREESRGGQNAVQVEVPLAEYGGVGTNGDGSNTVSTALSAARTFMLQHRDRVFVRPNPAFVEQRTVAVRGEIEFPGTYTLVHENETLADVISRAGGVRPTGYEKGGRLLRGGEQVVMNMERAIEGDRRFNAILQAGDEIVIPPRPNTVAIRGNVALEGLVKHIPGKRVSYYLERAGGVLDDTDAIYLTQASGARERVRRGFILSLTPVVDDGASIVVTKEPPKEPGSGVDVGEVISQSMAVLSSALTIIVLARRATD